MSIFDTADGRPDSLTLAEITEEERLFEEYLAARAEQAVTEMQAALHNRARNPAGAAKAKRVAAEAQAALAAQRRRVAEAEQAITSIRTKRSTRPPKRPKTTGRKSNRAQALRPRKRTATRCIQGSTRTRRSSGALIAAHRPASRPLPAPRKRQANKKPLRAKPKTEHTRGAPQASRNAQNRRRPGQAFRANQAARIEKVVASGPIPTVECSLCSARIPASAIRCSCGWRVVEGATRLPQVTLSASERVAIADGAKIARPAKRR